MRFQHDEIRDFHDNIRLDYGYAMTIASAQGLTVDRAFLLVDDRPERETIYPAATRHREGIDTQDVGGSRAAQLARIGLLGPQGHRLLGAFPPHLTAPTDPVNGRTPEARQRMPKSTEVTCES